MKSFTEKVQLVWVAPTLEQKKELLLDIVENFQYKDKQEQFRHKVHSIKTKYKADKLASDIALRGEGLNVL